MLKEKRNYIAVIKKSKSSHYGVIFPDFPSCVTAGKTLEEAQNMAEEALQFHVDGMIEDEEEVPNPLTLDVIKKKYKAAEAFLLVSVRTPSKAVRINITIDEKVLRKLDKYLETHEGSRSSFFGDAVRREVGC